MFPFHACSNLMEIISKRNFKVNFCLKSQYVHFGFFYLFLFFFFSVLYHLNNYRDFIIFISFDQRRKIFIYSFSFRFWFQYIDWLIDWFINTYIYIVHHPVYTTCMSFLLLIDYPKTSINKMTCLYPIQSNHIHIHISNR